MNRYLPFRKLVGVSILAMLFALAVALPVRSDQKQDIETIEKQIADLQKKLAEAKTKPATPATPTIPEPPVGTLPESILKKMAWRCIGPANMGGRITALAVYDADPTTYYVATASGGLLKTVNNGTTFDHQFDTQTTVSIGDVAVCQTNPDLVWVGTGEANPRNSVSYGDGVYKSIDGGKTWANMGLKKSFQIGKILIHPKNPEIVYVGALGRLYGVGGERGVWKTEDGGKTWKNVLVVDDKTGVIDMRLDPNAPETLIAALWERKRDEFDGFFGEAPVPDMYGPIVTHGPGGGIWKTIDGGKVWKKINDPKTNAGNGLPTVKTGRIGLDYSTKTKGLVYAIVDTEKVGTGDPPKLVYMGIVGESVEGGGAKLTEITADGPASKAGLKANEIVVAADGKKLENYEALIQVIQTKKEGDKLALTVKRDGKDVVLEVVLANRPVGTGINPRTGPSRGPRVSAGYRLASGEKGAKIGTLIEGGAADKAGLKEGDEIVAVEGKPVKSPEEYLEAVGNERKPGDKLKLSVLRGTEKKEFEIVLGTPATRGPSLTKPYALGLGGQQPNAIEQQGKDGFQTGGIYVSADSGDTWKRINSLNPRPMYFSVIRVDPSDDKVVYVTSDTGLWKSTDSGKTFRAGPAKGVHVDHHALWINPKNGKHLIIGCDGGYYVTYDAGLHWDHLNTVALGQFYHVAVDNKRPYRVYGGLQDNGSWGGPSNSLRSYGAVNEDWVYVNGGDGFVCRVDPTDSDLIYTESQGGMMSRRNFRTGERGFIRPPQKQSDPIQRFNWNTPYILSSHNPSIFYSAGEYVWRSVKKGADLRKISPEITRTKAGSATALSESPVNQDVVWAGTDDGFVWVTKDSGTTWTNVTEAIKTAGLPGFRCVATLEASKDKEGRCYACFDAHRSDDDKPYIFVTEDLGKTWKPIVANLPAFGSTRCLREDIVNTDMLYCGTEFGAFVSANRGQSWTKLGGNLPTVAVHEFAQPTVASELVVATHGRSVWVIDIASLRQMKPDAMKAKATLFAPATAVRWKTGSGGESPYSSSDRKFVGQNPRSGATIEYLLTKPAEKLTIKVVDVNGKSIIDFPKAEKTADYHRVVWPVGPGSRGAIGTYRVVLNVDGQEYTQPLQVELDPNASKDLITIEAEDDTPAPLNPNKPTKIPAVIDD